MRIRKKDLAGLNLPGLPKAAAVPRPPRKPAAGPPAPDAFPAAPPPAAPPKYPAELAPGVYRVVIPGHPPLLNAITLVKRKARMERLKEWKARVVEHGLNRLVPPAAVRRRVWIHLVVQNYSQAGDGDAYFKAVGDACTPPAGAASGALAGDTDRWVEWTHPTYSLGPLKETVLTFEDLPPDNVGTLESCRKAKKKGGPR